jgi:hypothetical protein
MNLIREITSKQIANEPNKRDFKQIEKELNKRSQAN